MVQLRGCYREAGSSLLDCIAIESGAGAADLALKLVNEVLHAPGSGEDQPDFAITVALEVIHDHRSCGGRIAPDITQKFQVDFLPRRGIRPGFGPCGHPTP